MLARILRPSTQLANTMAKRPFSDAFRNNFHQLRSENNLHAKARLLKELSEEVLEKRKTAHAPPLWHESLFNAFIHLKPGQAGIIHEELRPHVRKLGSLANEKREDDQHLSHLEHQIEKCARILKQSLKEHSHPVTSLTP